MKVQVLSSWTIIGTTLMNTVFAFSPAAKSVMSVKHLLHKHHSKTDHSENIFDGKLSKVMEEDDGQDYTDLILNLSDLLHESRDTFEKVKSLSKKVMDLEMSNPSIASQSIGNVSTELADAMAMARANSDVFGVASPESNQAWKRARLIAQGNFPAGVEYLKEDKTGNHNPKYNEKFVEAHHTKLTVVDPKVLKDAIEAIDKLEDLARQVQIEELRIEKHDRDGKGGLSP